MIAQSRPDGNAVAGRERTPQTLDFESESISEDEGVHPDSAAEEERWATKYANLQRVMAVTRDVNDAVDWDTVLSERQRARNRIFLPQRVPFEGSQLQAKHDSKPLGVFVPYWSVEATDNGNQAIVLAQLAYWFGENDKGECRAKIQEDGMLWIYKWNSQGAKETRLTERQVSRAMRVLMAKGIVVLEESKRYGRLYRLDPVRIESLRRCESDDEDDE